jgi:hypothetical protein
MRRVNISDPSFSYDRGDPEGFRAGMFSDKVGVWAGVKAEDVMVRRSSGVDYWHGETREDD